MDLGSTADANTKVMPLTGGPQAALASVPGLLHRVARPLRGIATTGQALLLVPTDCKLPCVESVPVPSTFTAAAAAGSVTVVLIAPFALKGEQSSCCCCSKIGCLPYSDADCVRLSGGDSGMSALPYLLLVAYPPEGAAAAVGAEKGPEGAAVSADKGLRDGDGDAPPVLTLTDPEPPAAPGAAAVRGRRYLCRSHTLDPAQLLMLLKLRATGV
jgi:hypothetical protein